MKKYLYLIIITQCNLFSSVIHAQWMEDRKPFPKEDSEYSLVYLERSKTYDYKYDDEGSFICDLTVHEIVKVYNDDALASYNRIYIPIGDMIELIDVKSRAITKNGKTIKLNKDDIHEIKDEESDSGYRIFAVEGAEVGGEIEYTYTKRIYGRTFINDTYQFDSPVKKYQLAVNVPNNLEFEFSFVNGGVEISTQEDVDEMNKYLMSIEDIPAYVSEPFSGGDAKKRRIDFRLSYNSLVGTKRINTYSAAGKHVYENLLSLSKDEVKLVSEFLNEKSINTDDKWKQFRFLEHEIKKESYTEDNAPDELSFFFENSFGNKLTFAKLFVQIAKELDLEFEVVLTSQRFEYKFNPDFDSWNYLTDYMIYFPAIDKFMAPHDQVHRLGSVPAEYTATYGLFIKPSMVTDFVYPISRIDYIPEDPYQSNMNNLDVKVELSDNLSTSNLSVKRIYLGREANYYKYALLWMDEERKDKMLKDLVNYLAVDADIQSMQIESANNDPENWHEQFVFSTDFSSENFIEVAGNTLLFKLGELIGAQSELYQEEERKFEIENFNNRGYERVIELRIPDGYKVENAEDIVINEKVNDGDKPIYLFESSYTIENQVLKVQINEFYDQIYYPKEDFEAFRKVINAAADWNKVTLVLKRS